MKWLAAFFSRDTGVAIVEVAQPGFKRRALCVKDIGVPARSCIAVYPSSRRLYSPGRRLPSKNHGVVQATLQKPPINPTNYDAIPTYVDGGKGLVHAIIETPAQIRHKYAFVPKYGIMLLKLTLAEGLAWPYDYGFIPQTRADDGDPTDVLVLGDAPTFSGCLLQVRILGAVLLKKDGVVNNRLVACPKKTPGVALSSDAFKDIDDIPKETLAAIEPIPNQSIPALKATRSNFDGTCSRKKALAMIDRDRKHFKNQSRKAKET